MLIIHMGCILLLPIEERRKYLNAMIKKKRNATDETREAYNKSMREYPC